MLYYFLFTANRIRMGTSRRSTLCSQESPHNSCGKFRQHQRKLIFVFKFNARPLILLFICSLSLMSVQECAHRFPVPLYGNDGRKQDKFVLTVPQDHLKCVVTLTGDSISHAVSWNFIIVCMINCHIANLKLFCFICRTLVLRLWERKIPFNVRRFHKMRRGNCNKCKMRPIIYNKRYITLTMSIVPITSSEFWWRQQLITNEHLIKTCFVFHQLQVIGWSTSHSGQYFRSIATWSI